MSDYWQSKLIKAGVSNLKEFGYDAVNATNILTDHVFAPFFAEMLKDNRGLDVDADKAIDALLAQIAQNKA